MGADVVNLREEVDQELERLASGTADSPSEPVDTLFPTDHLRVAGTAPLGVLNVGGKAPSVAKLKIAGLEVQAADGQTFRKGERLHVEGVLYVDGEGGKDKVDKKTGVVTDSAVLCSAVWVDVVLTPARDMPAA